MPSRIICVSGPEGSGKDTLIRRIRESFPELWFGRKATTRAPREDDIDPLTGESKYEYLSEAEFMQQFAAGQIAEFARAANGCLYGAYIEVEATGIQIRDIDVLGSRQLVALPQMVANFPAVTQIGILPPEANPSGLSHDEIIGLFRANDTRQARMPETMQTIQREMQRGLDQRIRLRGDSDELRQQKLERAAWEIPLILRTWPHVVINEDLDTATMQLESIVRQIVEQADEYSHVIGQL